MVTPMFKSFSRLMILAAIALLARPALAAGQPGPQQPYPDPIVGQLLSQLQFAQDDHDRQKAAKELGKIADPRTLPALEQAAVYDQAGSVRNEARKSALRLSGNVPPRQGLVFPQDSTGALMSQLLDGHKGGDREMAAKQLGALADPRALHALEIAAVFDRDGDVRAAARKAAVVVRRLLAARAAQEQMNRSQSAGPSDSAAPASGFVPPPPATGPAASYAAPTAPTTPPPAYYQSPTTPPVVAAPAMPQQPVPVPSPVYYYPPPNYYYYPGPAYYYPSPAYYDYPGPRFGLSLGFGFGFGHFHHR